MPLYLCLRLINRPCVGSGWGQKYWNCWKENWKCSSFIKSLFLHKFPNRPRLHGEILAEKHVDFKGHTKLSWEYVCYVGSSRSKFYCSRNMTDQFWKKEKKTIVILTGSCEIFFEIVFKIQNFLNDVLQISKMTKVFWNKLTKNVSLIPLL